MKKFLMISTMVAIMFGILISSVPIAAQETDPATVIQAVYEAVAAKDIDRAMALVADDMVLTLIPPPSGFDGTFIGKEEISSWYEGLAQDNGRAEFSDITVSGNRATWQARWWSNHFDQIGIGPAEFEGTNIVQGGLLKSATWVMSEPFLAKLAEVRVLEANKSVVRRFYDEIWNQGKIEVVDEIMDADFEDLFLGQTGSDKFKDAITGVRSAFPDLTVEYEDMVAEGDIVVVRITAAGTYQGGLPEVLGVPDSLIGQKILFFTGVDYAEIRDGKIVKGWGSHDGLAPLLEYGYELVSPDEAVPKK